MMNKRMKYKSSFYASKVYRVANWIYSWWYMVLLFIDRKYKKPIAIRNK